MSDLVLVPPSAFALFVGGGADHPGLGTNASAARFVARSGSAGDARTDTAGELDVQGSTGD